jgi:hypothetical protein
VLAVASALILTVGIVLFPLAIARQWRGDVRLGETTPRWWAYGAAAWRGYVRIMPVAGFVGGPALVILGWCFILLSSLNGHLLVGDPTVRSWLQVGAIGGACGMVVAAVIGLVVLLFNRPRWLVVPHMRSDRGLIGR